MAEGSERRSPSSRGRLHNFTLPGVNWGAQRTLWCMKVDPISGTSGSPVDSLITDRSQPPANGLLDRPESVESSVAEEKRKGKGKEISVSEKPWKLRTRPAAATAPEVNGGSRKTGGMGSGGGRGMNSNLWSPGQRRDSRLRAAEEKLSRPKFSYTLTKEEIECDFIAMTGAKPPNKSKKRPKAVQRKLNELAPGMWLKELTVDTYKVADDPEPRKGRK